MAGPGFSRPFISWLVAYVNPTLGKSWLSSPCSLRSQNPALSHQSPALAEELCSVRGPIHSPEGDSHLRCPPWPPWDLLAPTEPSSPKQWRLSWRRLHCPAWQWPFHHRFMMYFFPKTTQQESKIPYSLWCSHHTSGQHHLGSFLDGRSDLLAAPNISARAKPSVSAGVLGLSRHALLALPPRGWGGNTGCPVTNSMAIQTKAWRHHHCLHVKPGMVIRRCHPLYPHDLPLSQKL